MKTPVDAKFCNQCAASFAPVCSACGYENAAAAKFCNQCGTLLIASTSARGSAQIMQQEAASESRFQALIRAVMGMLQRERRVTYRSLKYVFRLEDGLLEEVKEELCLTGRAWDEGGKVLVWTGEMSPTVPPAVAMPMQRPIGEARAAPSSATSTPSPPVTDADVRPNERTSPPRGVVNRQTARRAHCRDRTCP